MVRVLLWLAILAPILVWRHGGEDDKTHEGEAMDNVVLQSALKFLIRRGLSILGTAGASVSDEWIGQTASLLLVGGNEAYQWWKAHKADKAKAETVKIAA